MELAFSHLNHAELFSGGSIDSALKFVVCYFAMGLLVDANSPDSESLRCFLQEKRQIFQNETKI